jgi:choline dehydrogenase-like flavoprotein
MTTDEVLYGVALYRLRPGDFGELKHAEGISPASPLTYDDFEPWYSRARQLLPQHRGGESGPHRHGQRHPHRRAPAQPDVVNPLHPLRVTR